MSALDQMIEQAENASFYYNGSNAFYFDQSQRPFENDCGGLVRDDSSSGCGPERAVAGWPTSPARPSGIRLT